MVGSSVVMVDERGTGHVLDLLWLTKELLVGCSVVMTPAEGFSRVPGMLWLTMKILGLSSL